MYQKSRPDVKREGQKETKAQDVGADPKTGGYGGRTGTVRAGVSVELSPTQKVAIVANSTRGDNSYPFGKVQRDPSLSARQTESGSGVKQAEARTMER